MKSNMFIIHIPHASLDMPNIFLERLTLPLEYIQKENIFISDYLVDKFVPKDFKNIVKFSYSRMFCDVERYLDDKQEEMSKYGMGVLYTKDSNQSTFIKYDDTYKSIVIKNYYKKHHNKLNNLTKKILKEYNKCYILDLHSYSSLFVDKLFGYKNNPDICIGINKTGYDKKLLNLTIKHFKKYGYTVKINYPYSGSLTPNIKSNNIYSMMIEINKRVYLNNNYNKFYKCMMDYYDKIKKQI